MTMECPHCQNPETRVLSTRQTDNGKMVRRRRECKNKGCKRRFTTLEGVLPATLLVIKKDGHEERFDRAKLEEGIKRAAGPHLLPEHKIIEIVNYVSSQLAAYEDPGEESKIESQEIGELVLERLFTVDQVVYMRFAAYFHHFTSVYDYIKYAERVIERKKQEREGQAYSANGAESV